MYKEVLATIIQEHNYKIIAEVGVYHCNLVNFLLDSRYLVTPSGSQLSEYWGIDPYKPYSSIDASYISKVTQQGWDVVYSYATQCMIRFKPFKIMRLPSVEAASLFPDKYFDLIFIDANHSYESVSEDIRVWLPKLNEGGWFGGHDYRTDLWPSVERAVREAFGEDGVQTLPGYVWKAILP